MFHASKLAPIVAPKFRSALLLFIVTKELRKIFSYAQNDNVTMHSSARGMSRIGASQRARMRDVSSKCAKRASV